MEELANINWALIAPLLGVQFILAVVALFDLARNYATKGPKWVWALVIIFLSMIGPIAYFIFGRKSS